MGVLTGEHDYENHIKPNNNHVWRIVYLIGLRGRGRDRWAG